MENGQIIFDGDTNNCIYKYLNKSKEEIGTKLSSIENRNGNGKLRFSDYCLYNKENETISEAISGEYLKIAINFDIHQKINFDGLIIAVNIKDSFDNAIISYVTDEMGVKFKKPIKNILNLKYLNYF